MHYGCPAPSVSQTLAPSIHCPPQGLTIAQALTKPTERQFPFFPLGIGGRELSYRDSIEHLSNPLSTKDFFVWLQRNHSRKIPQGPKAPGHPELSSTEGD